MTNTAIYFPPPFSQCYGYCPPNATRRDPTDIFITGETPQAIEQAKMRIHEALTRMRLFHRDVTILASKLDSILLSRMDKVRKIIEANATFIMIPPLGSRHGPVRIQGVENLQIERSIRELMALVSLYYSQRVGGELMLTPSQGRSVLHGIVDLLAA